VRYLDRKVHDLKKMTLAAVTWAAYVLAFILLYRPLGPIATTLIILPVTTTAWLFGKQAGIPAGLLAFPLNALLIARVGELNWDTLIGESLPGIILTALTGVIVGHIRDQGKEIEREQAGRRRAEQILQRRNSELALLNRTNQALGTTFDLGQVLAIVLEEVRRLMNVAACSVWLIDPLTSELVCRQSTGPGSDIARGWRLAPGEGISGWVAQHGESLIVPDTLTDERYSTNVGRRTGLALRSILSVPLKTKQDVIGVLQIVDEQAYRFNSTDLTLLEPLAASAAIAIDNARLVETLRQHTIELEARNEELERFTYVASHNLRTPLVNLQGFASELRAAFAAMMPTIASALPHLDEEQRQTIAALQKDVPEALNFIDSSATDLGRLTHALSKLSRLGHYELNLQPIDTYTLVQEILHTLSPQIAAHGATVTVDSLPQVIADRSAMKRIMKNLLNNALLYLVPGRPGEIEISAESNRDETTFHIRDNGRGIAEENMHKVFAPFRRAGELDVPGEGMGLVYAQTLIRRHGGRIWCKSEADIGTTFTFTISNHPSKMGGSNHV
jgi:signal transduction histidine kinase